MVKEDERNKEQKTTHYWGVVARDSFLSGWGVALGGYSRCAWATDCYEKARRLANWVNSRSEMKYVNIVDLRKYHPPRNTTHFHIYCVTDNSHPGLK